ncbi:hypothetical protein, partial [Selenomonas sp.]|uniref:hypothetical protein n=1 Tax=Selenomonas sp. TaxID=2053611 RepID=UPI002A74F6BF
MKRAEAAPAPTPAKPVAQAKQDIKTAYLSMSELDGPHMKDVIDVADGAALVLGFVSPDLELDDVARKVK